MPTSIDLFAGCGGLTRGLEWAGFECIAFNELNKDAADSFQVNFPDAMRLDGDVRESVSNQVIQDILLPAVGGVGEVDLICGGPPCQGYSGIGHRRTHKVQKKDIPTNHLFTEMIRVINLMKPKVFLFENVEGILFSKWTDEGKNGEIFRDVWGAFDSIKGYIAQPTLLHAYGFGVPQNRPRVMIMGVRKDLIPPQSKGVVTQPANFNAREDNERNVLTIQSYRQQLKNNGGWFPTWNKSTAPDPIDAIGDLDFEGWSKDHPMHQRKPTSDFQKQMRSGLGRVWLKQKLFNHEFSNHKPHVIERFTHMLENDGEIPEHLKTKKFNQQVLPARWGDKNPSITVTSLPDDYVHYARPRTFSVREWARLQTFPDQHQFMGKRTTGGSRRAGNPSKGIWDREVPQYTQIGNAVPPLLAKAVGEHIVKLLDEFANFRKQ